MFRSLLSFLLLTSLSSLAYTKNQSQAANLILNGSANYTQLTRAYYSAALYLEQREQSIAAIKSSPANKRMQLIVINRWTPRKWQAHWQGNISINNDTLPDNRKQNEALMAFINFPKDDLEPGDEIRIHASEGATQVYLNNELALNAPGHTLFLHLLNTWVGKFPPSREFRDQILGIKPNPGVRQRIEQHSIPDARQGLLSAWKAKQRQQQQAKLKQQKIKQQRIAREQAQKRLQEEQRRAKEQRRIKEEKQRKLALQQAKAAEQQAKTAEQQRLKKQAAAEQEKQKQQQALAEQKQAQILKEKASQQALQRTRYQQLVREQIIQSLVYPKAAQVLKKEGEVIVEIELATDGNILAVADKQLTRHRELNRALKKAIQDSAPFGDVPGATPMRMMMSYQFRLK